MTFFISVFIVFHFVIFVFNFPQTFDSYSIIYLALGQEVEKEMKYKIKNDKLKLKYIKHNKTNENPALGKSETGRLHSN